MRKFLFLGFSALLAASFTACKDDTLAVQNPSEVLDTDETFFVNVNINSVNSMTRADQGVTGPYDGDYDPSQEPNYDEGTPDENKVSTVFLIFYDEDGNRVSTTQIQKNNLAEGSTNYPSENALYYGVVQVDVKHGSKKPTSVVAFINPITTTNFEYNPDFATLETLEATTRPAIYNKDLGFAMSKSVYYGKDPNSANPNEMTRIMATPITNYQLFKSKDLAEKAANGSLSSSDDDDLEYEIGEGYDAENDYTVDIYVERYAVKVALELSESATKDYKFEFKDANGNVTATLKFIPEFWAVNAYESSTYVTKSFFEDIDSETGKGSGVASFAYMNSFLSGGDGTTIGTDPWVWNSELNHRSFWAQSPGYYSDRYPRVADDIMDGNGGMDWDQTADYGDLAKRGGYTLGYYSYNDMKKIYLADGQKIDGRARGLGNNPSNYNVIYARENTVSGEALISAYNSTEYSPKAAMSSIVLVGHYEFDDPSAVDAAPVDITEFYVTGNQTNGYQLYKNYDEMLKQFLSTTVRFYSDAKGEQPIFNYNNAETGFDSEGWADGKSDLKKYFTIKHPGKAVREDLIIDSRFVTIQLDEEKLENDFDDINLYAYISTETTGEYTGAYTKVTKDVLTQINQQMMYMAGTAQGFTDGMAYFTIPIQHLGFYRKNNPNKGKSASSKEFNWLKVQSGDFGIVRNHSYKIIVDNIKGLGNGIPNPDDPIVPPTDPEEYYIGARIIVLNWALVPDQHVIL